MDEISGTKILEYMRHLRGCGIVVPDTEEVNQTLSGLEGKDNYGLVHELIGRLASNNNPQLIGLYAQTIKKYTDMGLERHIAGPLYWESVDRSDVGGLSGKLKDPVSFEQKTRFLIRDDVFEIIKEFSDNRNASLALIYSGIYTQNYETVRKLGKTLGLYKGDEELLKNTAHIIARIVGATKDNDSITKISDAYFALGNTQENNKKNIQDMNRFVSYVTLSIDYYASRYAIDIVKPLSDLINVYKEDKDMISVLNCRSDALSSTRPDALSILLSTLNEFSDQEFKVQRRVFYSLLDIVAFQYLNFSIATDYWKKDISSLKNASQALISNKGTSQLDILLGELSNAPSEDPVEIQKVAAKYIKPSL